MSWRVALSLDVLLDEVNVRAPKRSKVSDGSIGDTAHSSRASDHNPNPAGVVCARDITDDPPDHNADEFTEWLRASRDPRIKYVIDQGRMFSSYATPTRPAWALGEYTGANAHEKHTHISVVSDPALYDSTKPWGWATSNKELTMFVEQGDSGPAVRYWQRRLNRAVPQAQRIVADGDYGKATVDLCSRVTSTAGGQVGPVHADRIEQAILVRALQRATTKVTGVDLNDLAREVAEELTIGVKK